MWFHPIAALFVTGVSVAAQPAFEVASVRMTPPGSIGNTSISPSGAARFTATNVSLEILISLAYGIDSNRIFGKQSCSSPSATTSALSRKVTAHGLTSS
jgi:hypothetical protein